VIYNLKIKYVKKAGLRDRPSIPKFLELRGQPIQFTANKIIICVAPPFPFGNYIYLRFRPFDWSEK